MPDDALAETLEKLESLIGPDRLSALRREAARRKVPLLSLISEAVVAYSDNLHKSAA